MTIDTAKYEGHTPAPWAWTTGHFLPDAHLITDAPLLLAEVKRLREGIERALYTRLSNGIKGWKELKELIE